MASDTRLIQIKRRLVPLRSALLEHPIYEKIDSIQGLRFFMQHHVFAVWDFMSLLKSLQQRLCGSNVPWLSPVRQKAARLVNEIVLAEESDEDGEGSFASHFEIYHRAMRKCGACTGTIDRFLDELRTDFSIKSSLTECKAPYCVRQFVQQTFDVIEGGELCAIASSFTFGREDLLPEVFRRIVNKLNVEANGSLDAFNFYLNRHIELDGDHHGPMANQMITGICDSDSKWQVAEEAAVRALQSRIVLWDGILEAMPAAGRSGAFAS